MPTDPLARAAAAYLPRWLLGRAAEGGEFEAPQTVTGTALVVDMAGFTELTNRHLDEGATGSEKTLAALNAWFEEVLRPIRHWGGDVLGFGGDCCTCLFTDPDPGRRRALAARVATEVLESVNIPGRIGAADGEVVLCARGDDRGRHPVTVGGALQDAARAMGAAEVGEARWWDGRAAVPLLGDGPLETAPATPLPVPDAERLRGLLPERLWESLLLPPEPGEHRTVTTLFARYGGLEDPPPELSRVGARLDEACAIIRRGGGYLQKLESTDKGTLLLAFFGAPLALHAAPRRAVATARELVAARDLAVGLSTGRVFAGDLGTPERREFTAIGAPVNRAARLLGLAKPGQVIADEATGEAATGFRFGPTEHAELKGFDAPVAWRALDTSRRPEAVPASRGFAPLIGRDAELTAMDAFLEDGGPPLLLVGEVGLGKTRLLREVAERASHRGFFPVFGHLGGPRAWSAFRELAAGLGQNPGEGPEALIDALALGLETADAPVLVVIEDFHLADPDDERLVSELARRLAANRGRLLASARPEGPIDRFPGDRLDLPALVTNDALSLLRHHAPTLSGGEAFGLVQRADGNPLFIEALATAVAETGETDLPASVEAAVRLRADALPRSDLRVLQAASIWGEAFAFGAIVAAVPHEPEMRLRGALGRLVETRFLETWGTGRWRFRHALEQRVIRDGLSESRRLALHRAALAWLATQGDAEPDALFVHLEAVGEHDRAAAIALAGAKSALTRGAFDRCIRLGTLARDRLTDPAWRAEAGYAVAKALQSRFRRDEAVAMALELRDEARALGDRSLEARAALVRAYCTSITAHYPESDEAVREVLAAAQDPTPIIEARMILGWNAWGRGLYPDARALLSEQLQKAEPGTFLELKVASALTSVLILLGEYAEALQAVIDSDRILESPGWAAILDYIDLALRAAAPHRARHYLELATQAANRTGRNEFDTHLGIREVKLAQQYGRWEAAAAQTTAVLEGLRATGSRYEAVGLSLHELSETLLAGDFDTARTDARALADTAEDIEAADEVARAEVLGALADTLAGRDLDRARGVAERNQGFARRSGRWDLTLELGVLTAVQADPGDPLEETLAACRRRGDKAGERFARVVSALSVAERDPALAEARWAELEQRLTSWGCPPWTTAAR